MKIVVITGSHHKNGTSAHLAAAFIRGAEETGHEVCRFDAAFRQVHPCIACETCHNTDRGCAFADDMKTLYPELLAADAVAFATPIYYYEMSGQMKTLLDRANSLFSSDCKFRDIYFLSTAADDGSGVDERALHGLEGWIVCYEKCKLAGKVFAGGVNAPGSINGHSALKEAFDMGAEIE